jgi:hypothetical protein
MCRGVTETLETSERLGCTLRIAAYHNAIQRMTKDPEWGLNNA